MKSKIIGTICLALGIIVIVTTGTSFAYFSSSVEGQGSIAGSSLEANLNLTVTPIKETEQLIPLEDNYVGIAVKNNCIDSKGYEVCALYKITLQNSGDPIILNGYITEGEESTYTTNNLKGQLFNNELSMSMSNVTTLSNTEGKQYFKVDDTNFLSTEVTTTNTFYLAIWLTETHTYQDADYNKDFTGKIAFEAVGGGEISATFSA